MIREAGPPAHNHRLPLSSPPAIRPGHHRAFRNRRDALGVPRSRHPRRPRRAARHHVLSRGRSTASDRSTLPAAIVPLRRASPDLSASGTPPSPRTSPSALSTAEVARRTSAVIRSHSAPLSGCAVRGPNQGFGPAEKRDCEINARNENVGGLELRRGTVGFPIVRTVEPAPPQRSGPLACRSK